MKLTEIDETSRPDHFQLAADDKCLFLFEYTSHRDFKFSETNNLISNLKKKPSTAAKPGYHYKERAIASCAKAFSKTLNGKWLDFATLVPTPGSKIAGHIDYDDRILQICRRIRQNPPVDVRPLVRQTQSYEASHTTGNRISVDELVAMYEIDEAIANPAPKAIGIVDDLLTVGVHFRAMHTVLSERFPGVPITGLFVARRVFANPFEALED